MEKHKNFLDDLLLKYYEGQTSLEEENMLEAYFLNHPNARAEHGWFNGRRLFKNQITSATLEASIVSNLEKNKPTNPFRLWYAGIAASVVFALLIFILHSFFIHQPPKLITVESGMLQKKITLPDGSSVMLNTNTTLQYPEKFEGSEREIRLSSGEAFFEVAKDTKHPFIVRTKDTRTEVVGTSFNIRTMASKRTEVIVITGAVSFNSGSLDEKEKVILNAGTAGTYHNDGERIERHDKINPNSIAWATRHLEFRDAPVKEVLETLESYFNVSIQTSDSNILSCRFRGSFKDASLTEIFEVMAFSLDLTISEQGKTFAISGKGCKQN